MCTQVLFVHLVRTERIPFAESRPDVRLAVLGCAAVALSFAVPFTGIGAALGFAVLPKSFLLVLPAIVAGYAACTLLVRRLYIRRYGKLL